MDAQNLYKYVWCFSPLIYVKKFDRDLVACERQLRETLKKGHQYIPADPLRERYGASTSLIIMYPCKLGACVCIGEKAICYYAKLVVVHG
jgi:hypothetical protein